MEELLNKAKELDITVADDITEEELTKIITEKENNQQEIENEKKKENKKKDKKKDKNVIRVLDDNNKPINKDIEKEKIKSLGAERQVNTAHSKPLKQAKNGEYYEELADGIGMWSRTGESFLLKDLDK